MKLQIKIGILFLVSALTIFLVGYWAVNSAYSDRLAVAQQEDIERSLNFSEVHARELLNGLDEKVDGAIESEKLSKQFKAISLVQFDSVASQWMSKKIIPSSRTDLNIYINEKLSQLPLESVKENNVQVFVLKNRNQSPEFFVAKKVKVKDVIEVKEYIAIAITSPLVFSKISEVSKSLKNNSFIVNNMGVALSYPEQPYVGQSLNDFSYIKKIVSERELQGQFFDDENKVYTGFKKIPGTNLIVVNRSGDYSVLASVKGVPVIGYVYFFAFAIIFLTIFLMVLNENQKEVNYLTGAIANVHGGNALSKPNIKITQLAKTIQQFEELVLGNRLVTESSAPKDESINNKAKEEIVEEITKQHNESLINVTEGMVTTVKDPLVSILGQLQVLKKGSEEKELLSKIEKIENEVRNTKEVIESIFDKKEEDHVQGKKLVEMIQMALNENLIQYEATAELESSSYSGPEKSFIQTLQLFVQYLYQSIYTGSAGKLLCRLDKDLKNNIRVCLSMDGVALTEVQVEKILEPQKHFTSLSERERVDLIMLKGLVERSHVFVSFSSDRKTIYLTPSSEHVDMVEVKKQIVAEKASVNAVDVDKTETVTAAALDLTVAEEVVDAYPEPSETVSGITKEDISQQVAQAAMELTASGLVDEEKIDDNKMEDMMGVKPLDESEITMLPPTPEAPKEKDDVEFLGESKALFLDTAYINSSEENIQEQLRKEFEASLDETGTESKIVASSPDEDSEETFLDVKTVASSNISLTGDESSGSLQLEQIEVIPKQEPEEEEQPPALEAAEAELPPALESSDEGEDFSFGPQVAFAEESGNELEVESLEKTETKDADNLVLKVRRPKLQR